MFHRRRESERSTGAKQDAAIEEFVRTKERWGERQRLRHEEGLNDLYEWARKQGFRLKPAPHPEMPGAPFWETPQIRLTVHALFDPATGGVSYYYLRCEPLSRGAASRLNRGWGFLAMGGRAYMELEDLTGDVQSLMRAFS